MSAVKRGEKALKSMVLAGVKVTKNAVAKQANFSHTNFRYPEFADLKDDIEAAAAKQKLDKQNSDIKVLKQKVTNLEVNLKTANKANKELHGKDNKSEIQQLMTKLVECYRLNDQLKDENNDLKNQLYHKMGAEEEQLKVDKGTGEVISGIFHK